MPLTLGERSLRWEETYESVIWKKDGMKKAEKKKKKKDNTFERTGRTEGRKEGTEDGRWLCLCFANRGFG